MTTLDDMTSVELHRWVTAQHNAKIDRLTAALRRIDAINDNPARYNSEINTVIKNALGDQ